MKVSLYYTEEIAWEQEVTIDEKELADWAGSKEITPDLIREFIVSDPEWHERLVEYRPMRTSLVEWCDATATAVRVLDA